MPVVAFDYAFLSDRRGKVVEDDESTDQSGSEVDGGATKILVVPDSRSKCCAAIPMPQKGIDADKWAERESLKCLILWEIRNESLRAIRINRSGLASQRGQHAEYDGEQPGRQLTEQWSHRKEDPNH